MTTPAVLLEWSPARPSRGSLRRRGRRRLGAITALFVLAIASLPTVALANVLYYANQDDRAGSDAVVVLGAAQYNGTPSPVLANRVLHAEDLVKQGVAHQVVTVGGFRTGDITSEAQVSKERLVAAGLPSAEVVAIPFGQDTRESVEAVATVAAEQGIQTVTIVSDPAHMARSRALARQAGLTVRVSPTQHGAGTALTARYLLRESIGLLTVWFDGL